MVNENCHLLDKRWFGFWFEFTQTTLCYSLNIDHFTLITRLKPNIPFDLVWEEPALCQLPVWSSHLLSLFDLLQLHESVKLMVTSAYEMCCFFSFITNSVNSNFNTETDMSSVFALISKNSRSESANPTFCSLQQSSSVLGRFHG